MQTKKNAKEKDLGEALRAIGWEMAKRFTDSIAYELDDTPPFPVTLTLKYRPGGKHDWYDDPAINITTEESNLCVSQNMIGYHNHAEDEDDGVNEE